MVEENEKVCIWKVVLGKGKITKVQWKREGTSHNLLLNWSYYNHHKI